jgi:hypothetical protein
VLAVAPDFHSTRDGRDANIRWIHRRDGDTEIYFLASPHKGVNLADCIFRVSGMKPELWHPDTGVMEPVAAYREKNGRTIVPIRFDPLESVFVVFRNFSKGADPVIALKRGDTDLLHQVAPTTQKAPELTIQKAVYGVINGKPEQQLDLTDRVSGAVKDGHLSIQATNQFAGRDPAQNVPKSLAVSYTLNGKPGSVTIAENETLDLPADILLGGHPAAELTSATTLEAWEAGAYTITTASGKRLSASVASLPAPVEIKGAWNLAFPPKLGAPDSVKLDKLTPWNVHEDDGVKHFSGTATYAKRIDIPADLMGEGKRVYLDLGAVKNLAEVTVNGKNLGILWKPPFRVDITSAAKAGANELEVRVTNLWPNRMIGDQSLPKEKRITWSAHEPYKKESPLLTSGLLGPVKLVPTVTTSLSSK